MRYASSILFLALLMLSACGTESSDSVRRTSTPPAVLVNACSSHAVGEMFKAEDGCNSCSCDAEGNMRCTEMYCIDGTSEK